MFNLLCRPIDLHVFLYNTIKLPYQPKHSHSSLVCIATVLKCEEKNKESNYNVVV